MPKSRETLGQRHYSFWQASEAQPDRYVYVIRGGSKNPIKIGKAKKPMQRLKTLQTGNAQTLRLLLIVPGWSELESVLHRRFDEYRLGTSEWFYGPGVSEAIAFVTELALYMVRSYQEGQDFEPEIWEHECWTDAERERLGRGPTIPLELDPIPSLASEQRDEPMERVYHFVPTIHSRVCRTNLAGPLHNNRGPLTQ